MRERVCSRQASLPPAVKCNALELSVFLCLCLCVYVCVRGDFGLWRHVSSAVAFNSIVLGRVVRRSIDYTAYQRAKASFYERHSALKYYYYYSTNSSKICCMKR